MVYKRGNIWWFKFVFNGQLIWRTTRQSNKKVALAMEADYRRQLQRGELGISEQPIPEFSEAFKQFLAWAKMTSKPLTVKRHETSGKALLAAFRGRKLSSITVNDVLAYQSQRLQAMHSVTGVQLRPATCNRELACLRSVFNYWIRQGCRLKNPVSQMKFADEDNENFYVLSKEDEALYLAAATQPLYDIALIMLRTGMRPGEVYVLKETHQPARKFLQVVKGKTKAARRKLYFGSDVREIFVTRIKNIDSDYLFPNEDDPTRPMTKVNNGHYGALERCRLRRCTTCGVAAIMKSKVGRGSGWVCSAKKGGCGAKYAKDAPEIVQQQVRQMKFRLYDLRHTAATRLARRTDLVTLAAILGHSKIQMVLRYAHPVEEQKQEAMLWLASSEVVTVFETVTNFDN
ncbi:MAG: tyrosine-type recombinase/integrase [Blastocatellia bacterium]